MSVWNPQSCRACTTTDVKFFNLHDPGLGELFAVLSGAPVLPTDGLPEVLCYYCCTQILRFKDFRLKCQKSLAFFRDAVQNVSSHSCNKTQYCIPLSRTKNLVLHYTPEDNVEYETDDIKTDNSNSDDVANSDYDGDDDWKDVDEKSNQLCEVKNEISTEEVDVKSDISKLNVTAESSNVLNTNKKTPHNSKTAAKGTKLQKTKRKTEANDKDKPKPKRGPKPKKKKCNRYNEKFEEDLEEFAKKYDVKVVCLSKEEQIRHVQERKETDAYKHSRLSCDFCYMGFMSEIAHTRHMKGHDPSSGAFVCEICQLRYSSRHYLNNHIRTSHKKRFICTLCGQQNTCINRAKLHSEWHRGLKFKCKDCEKEFNANSTYLNHKRELHKAVSCADCGESFRGTNELLRHTDVEHGNMKYKCDDCRVSFQSAEAVAIHSSDQACHGKTYPCRHCGANFRQNAKLLAHIAERHSERGFTCTLCGAIFSFEKHLTVHVNFNHSRRAKQKQYNENIVQSRSGKPRPKKSRSEAAGRDEEPERSYLCDVCAKSFTCPAKLKIHLQIHTGEKPYQCSICSKAFRTKGALEVHINVHTGQRPYKCRQCPEKFKSYGQRYKHKLLVHTGERPHKCSMCDKTYVIAYDLKAHVRFAHLHQPRPPRNRRKDHAPPPHDTH